MLPWKFFGLTPRDESGTLLRVWNQYSRSDIAGLTFEQQWRVPSDQAVMLIHFSAAANSSGAAPSLPRDCALVVENQNNEPVWATYGSFNASLGNQAVGTGTIGSFAVPLTGVLIPPQIPHSGLCRIHPSDRPIDSHCEHRRGADSTRRYSLVVMYDPTLEKIESLHPAVGERAFLMVQAAREAGIPLMVISGYRSADLNRQVGGAARSLHLQGRAFDVQVYGYTRDQVPSSWWSMLGNWAESNLGLRWGGRFSDPNHFDL